MEEGRGGKGGEARGGERRGGVCLLGPAGCLAGIEIEHGMLRRRRGGVGGVGRDEEEGLS